MRILILDDEPLAAKGLSRLVREILGSEIQSLKVLSNLTAALYYVKDNPIDLLFLDIDLDGENGYKMLEDSVKSSFFTIVTSAHAEYAVQAFEHNVLDFVPKPCNPERLKAALEKMENVRSLTGKGREFLPIKRSEVLELLPIDSIQYLKADRNYSIAHMTDGNTERIRGTLERLLKTLDEDFMRVHKSCVVRKSAIVRVLCEKNNTYKLLLEGDEIVPLSRTMYAKLRDGLPVEIRRA